MKLKFNEKVPQCYHPVTTKTKVYGYHPVRYYHGKIYYPSGPYEKLFSLRHRIWVGVRALFKSLFLFPLLSYSVRDDWRACWQGKRTILLYVPEVVRNQRFVEENDQDKDALNRLGLAYYEGKGVEKSVEKAEEYWGRAANLKCHFAIYNLACLYLHRKDYHKAKEWFQIAADIGHGFARSELEKLKKQGY
ncbi:MAG: tetratricopeptide repeat protein [Parachlamydiaceae bacterium]